MVKKKIKQGWIASREMLLKETLVDVYEHTWSFIGAFAGIGIIAFFQSKLLSNYENVFLIGSFGASSVLIYGALQSPLSKPRNLIGGHVISAFIRVVICNFEPHFYH
ncbi:MAG: HPP family protein [Mariniphaga sp.]